MESIVLKEKDKLLKKLIKISNDNEIIVLKEILNNNTIKSKKLSLKKQEPILASNKEISIANRFCELNYIRCIPKFKIIHDQIESYNKVSFNTLFYEKNRDHLHDSFYKEIDKIYNKYNVDADFIEINFFDNLKTISTESELYKKILLMCMCENNILKKQIKEILKLELEKKTIELNKLKINKLIINLKNYETSKQQIISSISFFANGKIREWSNNERRSELSI